MSRENFGSRTTYVLAMAGSAIGLGNVWRFPYMVGENGGAAFIILYLIFGILISLPIMFSEAVIGRRGRMGAYGTFEKLSPGTRWKNVGFLTVLTCLIFVSFYSVVGGWSFDYLVRSCSGNLESQTQQQATLLFGTISSRVYEPMIAFAVFLGSTALIVRLGIKKGIEIFSKITTPLLFVLILAIVIFSCTLPGAREGIDYLMHPDFSKITFKTMAYALGQSFFSLSLGVGCVLIYSSFMKNDDSIPVSGTLTFVFDTMFAIIAGFAIMPAVFSAGLEPSAGPSLVFETLPYIFNKMGEASPILSTGMTITFFLAIFIAALTSSIAMLEVCVEFVVEKWNISRGKATILLFCLAFVLGGLCCLSFGILSDIKLCGKNIFGFMDMLCSNFLMSFGALAFAVYVGWVMKKKVFTEEFSKGSGIKAGRRLTSFTFFMIKWVSPIMILIIFVTNLLF